MKLVTYTDNGVPGLGAVLSDSVIDLSRAYAAFQESTGYASPISSRSFPTDMLALLQAGDKMWEVLTATMHWLESAASASAIASVIRPLSQIHLRPLISNPSKIICIGLNYYDHCREQGVEVPKRPLFFAKFPSAIIGPDDSITWPADVSDQVDFEAELAVIIKRKARNIITDKVDEFIAGYTILNDISARDVQFADGQWTRGKSFDSFCPIGPYLVTCDEVGDPHRLAIRCWINGRLMQDSNTSELIFNVPYLLMYTSKTCTLLPGDIISTGTPGGVGVFRTPSVFLKSGDTVEIEIEKLGRLRNLVQ